MPLKQEAGGRRLTRRRLLGGAAVLATAAVGPARSAQPLVVGYNAALGVPAWTAPRAIATGLQIAIDEVNARGGVLGGRPLVLEALDHRSTVARSRDNTRTLAARPEVMAMFCDGFSPTALDLVPLVHELRLPLLNPWAAADGIIEHGQRPSYTFRLSLRDSWAMPVVVRRARDRGLQRLGLLALANAWGRSNEAALRSALSGTARGPALAAVEWHNPTDAAGAMTAHVQALQSAGADAIVLVGAVEDSCALVGAIAGMPAARRLPVLSHWGPTAGDFVGLCGDALAQVDLELVQTFLVEPDRRPRSAALVQEAARRLGVADPARLPSVAGVAHAYDLLHLLARAIDRAGRPDRAAVREALERLPPHDGVVRRLEQPFTRDRHEALTATDVFMARFDATGRLRRAA